MGTVPDLWSDRRMRRACSVCKAINRIPTRHLADAGKCGKCKAVLPPHDVPIEVTSATQFDDIVGLSRVPVLVDFWAAWCGPCRTIAPILDDLASQRGDVRFAKLNVDENPRTAAQFGVQSIPLLVFFRDGQETGRLVGAVPRTQIEAAIARYLDA